MKISSVLTTLILVLLIQWIAAKANDFSTIMQENVRTKEAPCHHPIAGNPYTFKYEGLLK